MANPTFVKQTWHGYWEPVTPLLSQVSLNILENLRKARKQYFLERFNHQSRISYCFYYFSLLEEVIRNLKNIEDDETTSTLLHRVLGFENFTVRWADGSSGAACSTSTIRNPCYLLAKIRRPHVQDDPKFIAMITCPDIANSTEAGLFYHYRQYKIDDEFGISLLLYPAAALSERANSFALIESFAPGFSDKSDPRTKQRSQILADLAISPFLSEMFFKMRLDFSQELNLVDIGSGNGALVSNIWRRILKTQPQIAQNSKLTCSMVGLRAQDPLRHFNKGSLRGTISYLDYSQADYLQWIQQQQKSDRGRYKFDVALICRLLNNLSEFKLNFSNSWRIVHKLGEEELDHAAWLSRRFEPHICLNPDNPSADSIFLKNTNILLKNGKSYRHLSLSNYYKGLQLLHNNDAPINCDKNTIYFPIRQFSPSCLRLPDGSSVLERLGNLAKLVVIEDVDLTKRDLIRHLVEYDLENISVSHVNRHNRLNSASIFCLCNKEFADLLPGKRIWPDLLQKIENRMYLRLRNYDVFQKYPQSI